MHSRTSTPQVFLNFLEKVPADWMTPHALQRQAHISAFQPACGARCLAGDGRSAHRLLQLTCMTAQDALQAACCQQKPHRGRRLLFPAGPSHSSFQAV